MNTPLDWSLITTWLAVRREGSLSAAGRKLGLSQPTVRRHVETLEAQVGSALFTRDTSGLRPLTGDARLLALAETIEAAALSFLRAASDSAARAEGTVRLSCPAVFGVEILPPVLAGLRQTHPAITVELAVTNRVEDILRHEADIGLRLVAPTQDRIVARKLAGVEIGLFATASLAAMFGAMDLSTLLAEAPFVGDDRRDLIAAGFRARGLPLPKRCVLRSDDDLAQFAAIRAGLGVGVCQIGLGEAAGLMRLCPEVTVRADAWLVTHEDLRHVARIRAVFDTLVASLG